jgi:hypothetical protein
MCFDRNINVNRDVKFLGCGYLLVQRCVKSFFLFQPFKKSSKNPNELEQK